MKPFAFMFPGQGSQAVGMLDAWGNHPAVVQALAEASEALQQDLAGLIRDGTKEALALTVNTQPVMLVAGVAVYRAWVAETGLLPVAAAGHSLGEYSALVAAGVLPLAQAAPLVRVRAQAMQDAVPAGAGAMAAILGLDATEVIAGCQEATLGGTPNDEERVEAVNFNDPAQTVIAGSRAAVERACAILKGRGAKRAVLLPVSAPFHSSFMQPAAEKLKEALASVTLATPAFAVINNVDVAAETDSDRIRAALYRQAFGPVRWVECVRALQGLGVSHLIECGPGRVLSGLAKRIDPDLSVAALSDPASIAAAQELLT